MKEPIHQIHRLNHIKHITRSMPLVAILFFIQNLVMQKAFPKESFGDYTVFCAVTICAYITMLFLYDSKIKTFVFEDRIETTTFFGSQKVMFIKDITKIIAPKNEASFSTIILCSKEQDMPLRFIDYPLQTQLLILKLKVDLDEKLDQAA